jgi:lysyl-tRNA synthetase class 2
MSSKNESSGHKIPDQPGQDASASEIEERKAKLAELRKAHDPYKRRFEKTHMIEALAEKAKDLKNGESLHGSKASVAGRLKSIRKHGKLIFADLQDSSGKIQLFIDEKGMGPEKFAFFDAMINTNDIVGAHGSVLRTQRGELSVHVDEFELLTKSLLPLPKDWYGLKDKELRYRKRYVDLILNPDVRKTFDNRTKIMQAIRDFMHERGFTEVETPILQPIYGGAAARPFESKLHALDMKVYMRISNELYLKRLIVGGYEKIFEFSRDFRNEGIDKLHNPEFTQVETMWAYADYKDNMTFAEEMFSFIAKKVHGHAKANYQGTELDMKTPWKRVRLLDAIKEHAHVDYDSLDFTEAKKAAHKAGVDAAKLDRCETWGHVVIATFEELVQPKLIQPTLVYDYPFEAAGLAKINKADPRLNEAFEIIINGWEMGLSYCEENDPQRLREYWQEAEKEFKRGDDESQRMDEDFIEALEYGMPPTSGLGVGIDRLTMLLTDAVSIRDVIMFPFMRPEAEAKPQDKPQEKHHEKKEEK